MGRALLARASDLLVVVEHGVHVLDPDGVDRSVEHDPLAVERHVPRVLAERRRQHAFTPQLSMGWVDPWLGWVGLGWVEIFQFLVG